MRVDRRVRLIRKTKPQPENHSPEDAPSPEPTVASEREIKNVVSRWVREHRQRSEEFRLTFAAIFKDGGLRVPSR